MWWKSATQVLLNKWEITIFIFLAWQKNSLNESGVGDNLGSGIDQPTRIFFFSNTPTVTHFVLFFHFFPTYSFTPNSSPSVFVQTNKLVLNLVYQSIFLFYPTFLFWNKKIFRYAYSNGMWYKVNLILKWKLKRLF